MNSSNKKENENIESESRLQNKNRFQGNLNNFEEFKQKDKEKAHYSNDQTVISLTITPKKNVYTIKQLNIIIY